MQPNTSDKIEAVLKRQLDVGHRLQNLLKDEYAALSQKDIEKLEKTVSGKHDEINNLIMLNQELLDVFSAQGIEVNENGLAEFFSENAIDKNHPVGMTWRQVQSTLADCHRQNQVNGKIIASSKMTNETLLNMLTGRQENQAGTYGPQGQAMKHDSSQGVIKV